MAAAERKQQQRNPTEKAKEAELASLNAKLEAARKTETEIWAKYKIDLALAKKHVNDCLDAVRAAKGHIWTLEWTTNEDKVTKIRMDYVGQIDTDPPIWILKPTDPLNTKIPWSPSVFHHDLRTTIVFAKDREHCLPLTHLEMGYKPPKSISLCFAGREIKTFHSRPCWLHASSSGGTATFDMRVVDIDGLRLEIAQPNLSFTSIERVELETRGVDTISIERSMKEDGEEEEEKEDESSSAGSMRTC